MGPPYRDMHSFAEDRHQVWPSSRGRGSSTRSSREEHGSSNRWVPQQEEAGQSGNVKGSRALSRDQYPSPPLARRSEARGDRPVEQWGHIAPSASDNRYSYSKPHHEAAYSHGSWQGSQQSTKKVMGQQQARWANGSQASGVMGPEGGRDVQERMGADQRMLYPRENAGRGGVGGGVGAARGGAPAAPSWAGSNGFGSSRYPGHDPAVIPASMPSRDRASSLSRYLGGSDRGSRGGCFGQGAPGEYPGDRGDTTGYSSGDRWEGGSQRRHLGQDACEGDRSFGLHSGTRQAEFGGREPEAVWVLDSSSSFAEAAAAAMSMGDRFLQVYSRKHRPDSRSSGEEGSLAATAAAAVPARSDGRNEQQKEWQQQQQHLRRSNSLESFVTALSKCPSASFGSQGDRAEGVLSRSARRGLFADLAGFGSVPVRRTAPYHQQQEEQEQRIQCPSSIGPSASIVAAAIERGHEAGQQQHQQHQHHQRQQQQQQHYAFQQQHQQQLMDPTFITKQQAAHSTTIAGGSSPPVPPGVLDWVLMGRPGLIQEGGNPSKASAGAAARDRAASAASSEAPGPKAATAGGGAAPSWFYIDPLGVIRGPVSAECLAEWIHRRYLHSSVLVAEWRGLGPPPPHGEWLPSREGFRTLDELVVEAVKVWEEVAVSNRSSRSGSSGSSGRGSSSSRRGGHSSGRMQHGKEEQLEGGQGTEQGERHAGAAVAVAGGPGRGGGALNSEVEERVTTGVVTAGGTRNSLQQQQEEQQKKKQQGQQQQQQQQQEQQRSGSDGDEGAQGSFTGAATATAAAAACNVKGAHGAACAGSQAGEVQLLGCDGDLALGLQSSGPGGAEVVREVGGESACLGRGGGGLAAGAGVKQPVLTAAAEGPQAEEGMVGGEYEEGPQWQPPASVGPPEAGAEGEAGKGDCTKNLQDPSGLSREEVAAAEGALEGNTCKAAGPSLAALETADSFRDFSAGDASAAGDGNGDAAASVLSVPLPTADDDLADHTAAAAAAGAADEEVAAPAGGEAVASGGEAEGEATAGGEATAATAAAAGGEATAATAAAGGQAAVLAEAVHYLAGAEGCDTPTGAAAAPMEAATEATELYVEHIDPYTLLHEDVSHDLWVKAFTGKSPAVANLFWEQLQQQFRRSCPAAASSGSTAPGDGGSSSRRSSSRRPSGAISLICRLTKHSTHQQMPKSAGSNSGAGERGDGSGTSCGGVEAEGECEEGWEELGPPLWYYLDPFGKFKR